MLLGLALTFLGVCLFSCVRAACSECAVLRRCCGVAALRFVPLWELRHRLCGIGIQRAGCLAALIAINPSPRRYYESKFGYNNITNLPDIPVTDTDKIFPYFFGHALQPGVSGTLVATQRAPVAQVGTSVVWSLWRRKARNIESNFEP